MQLIITERPETLLGLPSQCAVIVTGLHDEEARLYAEQDHPDDPEYGERSHPRRRRDNRCLVGNLGGLPGDHPPGSVLVLVHVAEACREFIEVPVARHAHLGDSG